MVQGHVFLRMCVFVCVCVCVWNRKKGRGHTDFKNEGKLGQGMGALKKWGTGSPHTNYGYRSVFRIL